MLTAWKIFDGCQQNICKAAVLNLQKIFRSSAFVTKYDKNIWSTMEKKQTKKLSFSKQASVLRRGTHTQHYSQAKQLRFYIN